MIRAVLDTNVIISALLFSGPPSHLIPAWRSGRLRPVVSAPMLDESIRLLAYPKFRLTESDIRGLLEEYLLPFIESVTVPSSITPTVGDPDDAKFLTCALTASVRWLVSGNDDLLSLRRVNTVEIVSVTSFLPRLTRTT